MAIATTRFEATYQRLRQMLLDGQYLPRERLVEADLVRALDVSRSTVRAVLVRLQQEGLVEIEPNRGARVSTLSFREAVEHLELLEVLDGLVARVAASRMSDADLAALAALYAEMERALRADDLLGYVALNRRFHQRIVDGAGPHRAALLLGSLLPQLARQQPEVIFLPSRREQSLSEHLAIVRALEARQPEAAEAAARLHTRAFREAFIRANVQMSATLG